MKEFRESYLNTTWDFSVLKISSLCLGLPVDMCTHCGRHISERVDNFLFCVAVAVDTLEHVKLDNGK